MLERPSLERFVGARINSYAVEQLIEQSELGALCSARDSRNGSQYVLAVLNMSLAAENSGYPSPVGPGISTAYDAFAHQASTIASLQHPYILPLVDYGSVGEMPYLAWPTVASRPLTNRLAQGGSLDLLTVGRYLDQIAAALEYAHEHLVLHRSLTVDSLSLQRDGRILVHDFGIRRMLELGRKDAEWYALRNWNEACAPEQILGNQVSPATDVYAMGIILYQLLTGEAPYSGARRKDIMQQHLQAPIPSIRTRRPDLPGELDAVLATATAKQASDRFSQPGAFANAYYDIVSPQQAGRVPFKLNTGVILSGTATAINGATSNGNAGYERVSSVPSRPTPVPTSTLNQLEPLSALPRYRAGSPPPPTSTITAYSPRFSPLRTLLIAGLVVAVILGSFLVVTKLQSSLSPLPSGQVTFMDSSAQALGQTNALEIQVTGLALPSSGGAYHAWMIDQQSERVLALGALVPHGHDYSLSYQSIGAAGGDTGTNLLTLGDLLEITLEQGNALLPTGKVVMSGIFPPMAFVHVGHLLVSYPTTPGKIGLLVGAEIDTVLLETQAEALQTAAAGHDVAAIQCEVQSILDIIQGSKGPQYQPLPSSCSLQHSATAGDGFGLLGTNSPTYNTLTGYLSSASEHAALAATQPDATPNLRLYAHSVEVTISTVVGWVTTIQQNAIVLEKTPQYQPAIQAIVTLAGEALHGVQQSGRQQTSPATGEGGIRSAFSEGQQMATLKLVSKS
jgi:serine/threonine protein kinase